MNTKKYVSLIVILGSLTALAPFSIDMYLPGFPAIANDLHTTASKVSLSLSGFFIGISVGQLLYGPLLDKFGRKKPLYAGLLIYIVASVGCSFASDIDSLIGLRFVEAIGGCSASVAAMAMVRDLFPVKDSAKVYSLLMLVVGASPMVAPTIGGYITAGIGWEAVFLVLAGMGLAMLIAGALWLPDSYQPDPDIQLKPLPILKNFISVLRNPQFTTYALTASVSLSGLFAYVASSPMVFMEVFHTGQKSYGWIFAFLSIGLIGSSQFNAMLLRKYSSENIIRTMLAGQLIFSSILLIVSISGFLNLPLIILLLFLILSCVGILHPNAAALSLAPFSKNAGSASAVMGAIQMGAGAFITIIISIFEDISILPMAFAMAGTSVAAFLILMIGSKKIPKATYVNAQSDATILH